MSAVDLWYVSYLSSSDYHSIALGGRSRQDSSSFSGNSYTFSGDTPSVPTPAWQSTYTTSPWTPTEPCKNASKAKVSKAERCCTAPCSATPTPTYAPSATYSPRPPANSTA